MIRCEYCQATVSSLERHDCDQKRWWEQNFRKESASVAKQVLSFCRFCGAELERSDRRHELECSHRKWLQRTYEGSRPNPVRPPDLSLKAPAARLQKLFAKTDPTMSRLRAIVEMANAVRDDQTYADCYSALSLLPELLGRVEAGDPRAKALLPRAVGSGELIVKIAVKIEDELDDLTDLNPAEALRDLERIESGGEGRRTPEAIRERLVAARACREEIERRRKKLVSVVEDLRALLTGRPIQKAPAMAEAARPLVRPPAVDLPESFFDKVLGPVSVSRTLQRLGSYSVLEELRDGRLIAEGPTGPVVLETVRFDADTTHDDAALHNLRRNCELLGRTDHPHLARFVEMGESDGTYFVALAKVEGITLAQVLAERRLLPIEAARVGIELFDALEHLHAESILVRSFRAEGVIVQRDGHVTLAELGLARFVEEVTGTATSFSLGSSWMAPELFSGGHATRESDQWVLARFILSLASPLENSGRKMSLIEKLEAASSVDLNTLGGSRHANILANVLGRALQREPSERFSNAREAQIALERAVAEMTSER